MILSNHMKKIILGFVGELASGKGTACRYLHKKYGAPSYRFSNILRDLLKRLSLDITRENQQHMSQILRETFGQDTLARVIAADVTGDPSELITVDGVRRLPDLSYLKKIPGFFLVSIIADPLTRYQRLIKRGENSDDTTKTFEQFQRDSQAEAELQIQEAAQTAQWTIDNNGTLDELHQQLEHILQSVKL